VSMCLLAACCMWLAIIVSAPHTTTHPPLVKPVSTWYMPAFWLRRCRVLPAAAGVAPADSEAKGRSECAF
jgi:hypothetical protein